MSCKYCNSEYNELPEFIENGEFVGRVFDTCLEEVAGEWYIMLPTSFDLVIKFCPYCGRKLSEND